LARRTTQLYAIPLLLYYNLLFILPMLVLSVSIYVGYLSGESAKIWRDKHKRPLHLLVGIVMLVLY